MSKEEEFYIQVVQEMSPHTAIGASPNGVGGFSVLSGNPPPVHPTTSNSMTLLFPKGMGTAFQS